MLAEKLARHPAIAAVHFPGLPGQDPMGLLGRQMKGPGSLMAFELKGGFEAAAIVMAEVNRAPFANEMSMSNRRAAASKRDPATNHGCFSSSAA